MPELNVFLILFPTEENFLPADESRKIDEAAIDVFDLNFALFELAQQTFDSGEGLNPLVHRLATHIGARREHLGQPLVILLQSVSLDRKSVV